MKLALSLAFRFRTTLIICLTIIASVPALAREQVTATTAQPIVVGEYKLPASVDPAVTSDVETELWAAVYRPSRDGRYPLLVFLHGNHNTCGRNDPELGIRIDDRFDYTYTGTCPKGWLPTPNHLGYGYLAKELAANGYVVVSINANRGVNVADGVDGDFGLNLRRGRLVLRHMQQLAAWNSGRVATPANLGFSMRGLMNFDQVGLMGHSRGGEGMRAVLAQYRDKGSPWPRRIGKTNFRAMFEIGPVDGQTARTLDADGVAWNVLLPACDGDVATLDGIQPLDRMIMRSAERLALPKSSIEVFGANHNFYNTEWQTSDSTECPGQPMLFPAYGGSEQQRQTARETVIPFFRAHVGGAALSILADRFDPSRPLPLSMQSITYFARGHATSLQKGSSFIIDDFTRDTGKSSRGATNIFHLIDEYHHGDAGFTHDPAQRAAKIGWSSRNAYLQVNASNTSVSLRRNGYRSLEFRVKLECDATLCSRDINPGGDVDFSIRLVNGNGSLSSPVKLSSAARVYRPVSAYSRYGWTNSVFQTVRIPISSFAGAEMSRFRGVRFSFDGSERNKISLGNVRLVKAAAGSPGPAAVAAAATSPRQAQRLEEPATGKNEVVAIRRGATASRAVPDAARVEMEIELTSTRDFGVTDALPTLYIGDQRFRLSRFVDGRTDRMIFSISDDAYRSLPNGAAIRLVIGGAPVWNFGKLSKP